MFYINQNIHIIHIIHVYRQKVKMMMKLGMRQALVRLITKLTKRQQQEKELFTFYHHGTSKAVIGGEKLVSRTLAAANAGTAAATL